MSGIKEMLIDYRFACLLSYERRLDLGCLCYVCELTVFDLAVLCDWYVNVIFI